jgi:hypothetical protein
MRLFNKLFHSKTTPKETVVPDEYIKQYPEPQEVLQKILDIVPGTGYLLYQYTKHSNISKEWKFWAMDLMENGLGTPSVIQLAGEDLDMDYWSFSNLLETVFQELGIEVNQEVFHCAYVMGIAQEVLHGERTARTGFELLSQATIETNYKAPFYDFYCWLDHADELEYYTIKGSGLYKDNVEEWMKQFFEKLVKVNPKYCSNTVR